MKPIFFYLLVLLQTRAVAQFTATPAPELLESDVALSDAVHQAEALKQIRQAQKTNADTLSLKNLHLKQLPTALSAWTGLKRLDLSNNKIQELSLLQTLPQLTSLNLRRNDIRDIHSLNHLTQLTHLNLSRNQIRDLVWLERLTNLTHLDISYNPLEYFNLDINKLPQLTLLTLDRKRANNIPARIKGLTGAVLKSSAARVAKYDDNVAVLSPEKINELRLFQRSPEAWTQQTLDTIFHHYKEFGQVLLDLAGLNLTSVPSNVLTLNKLHILKLNNNLIANINALSGLNTLLRLELYDNQIHDVAALQSLSQLTMLDLSNNQIQQFNLDLELLPQLKYLHLAGNPIQNIPQEIIGKHGDNCVHKLRQYQKSNKK